MTADKTITLTLSREAAETLRIILECPDVPHPNALNNSQWREYLDIKARLFLALKRAE